MQMRCSIWVSCIVEDAEAMFNYACMCRNGCEADAYGEARGPDLTKARQWFARAAARGYTRAAEAVNEIDEYVASSALSDGDADRVHGG